MTKIISREPMGQGRFIKLEKINFIDERGRNRDWESCSRLNSNGAVIIVPVIEPDGEFVLVRQFRPPANCYVIEFPAGLIDPGEDFETAAVRELKEETGYEGKIVKSFAPGFSSPGLSSEKIGMVFVEIDGRKYRDTVPETFQEDTECIEIFRVKKHKLYEFMQKAIANGDGVDTKLWPFAYINQL